MNRPGFVEELIPRDPMARPSKYSPELRERAVQSGSSSSTRTSIHRSGRRFGRSPTRLGCWSHSNCEIYNSALWLLEDANPGHLFRLTRK